MRRLFIVSLFIPVLLLGQTSTKPDSQQQNQAAPGVSGRWMIAADFWGTTANFSLNLQQQGDKITGEFSRQKLEGSVTGSSLHFLAKDQDGGSVEGNASFQGTTMAGTLIFTD